MADVVIYGSVKECLPQDYVGPAPLSVQQTLASLLDWMKDTQTDSIKLLTPKGEKYEVGIVPIDKFQLDSSLFTDKGNDMMSHCFDRWLSSMDMDHLVQGPSVPLDINQVNFEPFIQMFKRLEGDPHYVNAEPNIEDAYKDTENVPTIEVEDVKSESFSFLNLLDKDNSSNKVIQESKVTVHNQSKEIKTLDDLLATL